MLLRKTFPADVRVAKEARALRAGGYEIVLLCREYDDRPARETTEGIEVVITYVGKFAPHHGVETVVRALYRDLESSLSHQSVPRSAPDDESTSERYRGRRGSRAPHRSILSH